MLLDRNMTKKIFRYTAQGSIIYLLFRCVPENKPSPTDALLMTLILTLISLFLENANIVREKFLSGLGSNKDCKCDEPVKDLGKNTLGSELKGCAAKSAKFLPGYNIVGNQKQLNEKDDDKKEDDKKDKKSIEGMTNVKFNLKSNTSSTKQQSSDSDTKQQSSDSDTKQQSSDSDTKQQSSDSDTKQQSSDTSYQQESDMQYNDYGLIPVPTDYESKSYEYGYSFLPPAQWYPQPPRSPPCVTNNPCPVCPVYTTGSPIDVKEWDNANDILPSDNISIEYINEKLNKIEKKLEDK